MRIRTTKMAMAVGLCAAAATIVASGQNSDGERAPKETRVASVAGEQPGAEETRNAFEGQFVPKMEDYMAPLPEPLGVTRHVAVADGADGETVERAPLSGAAAGEATTLVYSNTAGRTLVRTLDAGGRVSDDIVITAVNGCALDRYVVRVVGNFTGSPTETRPLNVTMFLTSTCPGASPGQPVIPISGTSCSFNDLAPGTEPGQPGHPTNPHELICQIDPETAVALPNSFYVSLNFSRGNSGVVAGALPLVGFSADRFDFPGAACTAVLGSVGFPTNPHASFFTQVFVRGECRETFLTYRDSNHAGPAFSPGGDVQFADELIISELEGCNLIGYEFVAKAAVSGVSGRVEAELRRNLTTDINDGRCANDAFCNVETFRTCGTTGECVAGTCVGGSNNGSPCCEDGSTCLHRETLRGTETSQAVFGIPSPIPRVHRVIFRSCVGGDREGERCTADSQCGEGGTCTGLAPIAFDRDQLFIVFKTSISQVGPLWTKFPASWGTTPNNIRIFRNNQWEQEVLSPGHSAFDVTLFCDGEAPPGACCDMVQTVNRACVGGPRDGKTCALNTDCECPSDGFICDSGARQGESCDPLAKDPNDPVVGCPDDGICIGCTFLPGRCVGDSLCRNIPRINCTSRFLRPAGFDELFQPGTVCGGTCVAGLNDGEPCTEQANCPSGECQGGPFPLPCGKAACCPADDLCRNLTERECNLLPPEDKDARQFRRGETCQFADCPRGACLAADGDCLSANLSTCIFGGLEGQPCDPGGNVRFDCGGVCFGVAPNPNTHLVCTDTDECPNTNVCCNSIDDPPACQFRAGLCTEEAIACTTDNECLRNTVCLGGFCRDTCIFDIDCPTQGETCALRACVGGTRNDLPCLTDANCPSLPGSLIVATCEVPGGKSVCPLRPGCENPPCCSEVCEIDPPCCNVTWDSTCAARAADAERCQSIPPPNDECSVDGDPTLGAKLLGTNNVTERVELGRADSSDTEPPFCCLPEGAGQTGEGTAWFKFVAPQVGSVRVDTCGSNFPATDSIIQVFAVGDPDRGRCDDGSACSVSEQDCLSGECVFTCDDNVSLLACNDDAEGNECSGLGQSPSNSSLCATGLIPGDTYFIKISAKRDFRCDGGIRNQQVCDPTQDPSNTDCPGECNDGTLEGEPCVENDDCPGGSCSADAQNPGAACTNIGLCPGGTCVFATCSSPNPGACRDRASTAAYNLRLTSNCTISGLPPLPNDLCINARAISGTSVTEFFDLTGNDPFTEEPTHRPATFDCPGPPDSCVPDAEEDIWYDWTSPVFGGATFEACGDEDVPVNMVVHRGCECPAVFDATTLCPDPENPPGACGEGSRITVPVQAGECFKVRISGVGGELPKGTLTIGTEDCPNATPSFVDPPNNTIDARQPFPPDDPVNLQGISEILISSTTAGIENLECWTLCETDALGDDSPVPIELRINAIESIVPVDGMPNHYRMTLRRPITPNAMTQFIFVRGNGSTLPRQFFFHPGNVNLDGVVSAADVDVLRTIVENEVMQPGPFLTNMDHTDSNPPRPQVILRLIDMINGGDALPSQDGEEFPPGQCIPGG